MWVVCRFLNRLTIIVVDFRSEKGFNASQRSDPKLKTFMKNLAHFSINNLNDLISERQNFFRIEDFVEVKFVYRSIDKLLTLFPLRLWWKSPITSRTTSPSLQPPTFSSSRQFSPTTWACVSHSIQEFLRISRPSESVKFSSFFTTRDFAGFSFLVSGNLESNSRVKSLEEISYFDGDASAVTADLSNNVDVNFSFHFWGENFFSRFSKTISDLLSRAEWVASDAEANRQRRPRAEKLHFACSRADDD